MLRVDRLHHLRTGNNYTFEELARLLTLSLRQVMRYEAGESEPTAGVIARMANVFDVTADYLLGRSDDPNPSRPVGDLTPKERAVLSSLRSGDKLEAIRWIVLDEK